MECRAQSVYCFSRAGRRGATLDFAGCEERRRGGSEDCLRDTPVACHGPKGS